MIVKIPKTVNLLGLNYFGHDTSAALIRDGDVVAAIAQERITRKKHDRTFPAEAAESLLRSENLNIDEVACIALSFDSTFYKESAYSLAQHYPSIKIDIDNGKLAKIQEEKEKIRTILGFRGPIKEYHHHKCHLKATFHQSGFTDALGVSIDGIGEISSFAHALLRNGKLSNYQEGDHYPNSLGLFYSALTNYLGWKNHCDEGIIMGLAPFGNPKKMISSSNRSYEDIFNEMVSINETTGDVDLNTEYFSFHLQRDTWVSEELIAILGPRRVPDSNIEQRHCDIASALQKTLESAIEKKILHLLQQSPKIDCLCLSGGVALNCSNNGKILDSGLFQKVFVQPASSDDGTAIGAGLLCYDELAEKGNVDENLGITLKASRNAAYLGPEYSIERIEKAVRKYVEGAKALESLISQSARLLVDGKIIAWYNGRSEFGPRALGNRSILAIPNPGSVKDNINGRIKFRETFRPFAPVCLEEYASQYFDVSSPTPYMLFAVNSLHNGKKNCPATVHVDGTARLQTVNKEQNLTLYNLLKQVQAVSGVPILLNTSFNVKGQPIVETPEEALETFLSTNIDALAIGNFLLHKDKLGRVVSL